MSGHVEVFETEWTQDGDICSFFEEDFPEPKSPSIEGYLLFWNTPMLTQF